MTALGLLRYESVPLTTLARLNEARELSVQDTSQDALLTRLIQEVSDEIARYLNLHTLRATRTEVHEIRSGTSPVTLDARPIHDLQQVRYGATVTELLASSAITVPCFSAHANTGWLRMKVASGGFVEVTYEGGFGTDPNVATNAPLGVQTLPLSVVDAFPDLAQACEMQVDYRHKRQNTLGGNVKTIPGASTEYQKPYGMLPAVKAILDRYKRTAF